MKLEVDGGRFYSSIAVLFSAGGAFSHVIYDAPLSILGEMKEARQRRWGVLQLIEVPHVGCLEAGGQCNT